MSKDSIASGPSRPSPQRLKSKAQKDLVETCGGLLQSLGLPRSTGQIYGLLYLSVSPLSLDDMVSRLAISKGSASMGTRHLVSWEVIRQVWVPGDRRDHYEAMGDFAQLLRASYAEFVQPRLSASEQSLTRLFDQLEKDAENGVLSVEEYKLCTERLRLFLRFQEKIRGIWPLAEKMLS